jgi:hypothetical protein
MNTTHLFDEKSLFEVKMVVKSKFRHRYVSNMYSSKSKTAAAKLGGNIVDLTDFCNERQ